MKAEELRQEIERLSPWFHTIVLPADEGLSISTPGEPYQDVWDNTRKMMRGMDYQGKKVLDIGTFDGLWAFMAEWDEAQLVVATDCNWEAQERFMLCHRALRSKVVPVFGVALHELRDRLSFYLDGRDVRWGTRHTASCDTTNPKFDIVQHLGVFYHLRDPMLSLVQCRSVIRDGGTLLIETAFVPDEQRAVMLFNGNDQWNIYDDPTTWWSPSKPCLEQMLVASCFRPTGTCSIYNPPEGKIGRICMTATATPFDQVDPKLMAELKNTYRTPGLCLK